jgi:hypothetical protein
MECRRASVPRLNRERFLEQQGTEATENKLCVLRMLLFETAPTHPVKPNLPRRSGAKAGRAQSCPIVSNRVIFYVPGLATTSFFLLSCPPKLHQRRRMRIFAANQHKSISMSYLQSRRASCQSSPIKVNQGKSYLRDARHSIALPRRKRTARNCQRPVRSRNGETSSIFQRRLGHWAAVTGRRYSGGN